MLPQDQALNIPGIFELILLSLPARSLLTTAPLVCRHWRDFIASSTRLQQELFFQPVSSPRGPDSHLALPRFNPLLEELFPGFFEIRHGQTFNIRRGGRGQTSYCTSPGWSRLAIVKQPRAFVRSGASWRRMLPRQPPSIMADTGILDEEVATACRAPSKRSFYWRQLVDNYDDGDNLLRMGVLYDLVHDFCDTAHAECAIVWAVGTMKVANSMTLRKDAELVKRWKAAACAMESCTENMVTQMLDSMDIVVRRRYQYQIQGYHHPKVPDWRSLRSRDFKEVGTVLYIEYHHTDREDEDEDDEDEEEEEGRTA